jgi:hypothetical protein
MPKQRSPTARSGVSITCAVSVDRYPFPTAFCHAQNLCCFSQSVEEFRIGSSASKWKVWPEIRARELSAQAAAPADSVKRKDGPQDDPRTLKLLRATVTLALMAGAPLELMQKVTGHKTTDIVLQHYFQPGPEDSRQTLQSVMPKLLTNGHKTPKEEMRELLETVKPKALREQLLRVWAKW